MRRLLAAAALIAAVLGAISCGDDDADGGAPATLAATQAVASPTKASGTLILATTTSTQDSGLLDVLVPMFEEETGYNVKTVAVGSGQAIAQASNGDADVVLAHSPDAEKKMVDAGDGIERALVMHNDFIIVGPAADPADAGAVTTVADVMDRIAASEARFISRGDDSGTHALEKKLWEAAGIDPAGAGWYEESGQGMGATLQIANQKDAYTVTDRATFLALGDSLDLVLLHDGDERLLNVYHVIVVNPERYRGVNAAAARAFAAFLVRADVQDVIGEFGVADFGEPLFFPDAGKPEPAGG